MQENRPLNGLKILEFAGIGPAPYAGQLLADLGADVVVVDRPSRGQIGLEHGVDRRGKRSIVIDLKAPEGAALAATLASKVDVLIEGNRPGVMERLGLGPAPLMAKNPALIYARMTGWGQNGPMALQAGHDINYLALTGALHAIGDADRPPPPPLNLVGDFGGGSMFLIMGIMAALYGARTTGKGQIVDAAIVDGVNSMMGMFHGLHAFGEWSPERQANWLDGGAPYYRCYQTLDGRFMAVGCIEPKFFAEMLRLLEISAEQFGAQRDTAKHPAQAAHLESVFASRKMADWAALFEGSDACVTPVLTYEEAGDDPHIAAREGLHKYNKMQHPAIAPRFGGLEKTATRIPDDGEHTIEVMEEFDIDDIGSLLALGVARQG